jgi:hypothetical protein
MPSINLRQLRDTKQVKALLESGQVVELRDRNRRLGRIVPDEQLPTASAWPDAAERRRRIFGDTMLPGISVILEEREESRF